MNTEIKNLLSENRDTIISAIKWTFKVYSTEDVKAKMIEYLNYCEANSDYVLHCRGNQTVKQHLKSILNKLYNESTKNLKVAEMIADLHEGERYNRLSKTWEKI